MTTAIDDALAGESKIFADAVKSIISGDLPTLSALLRQYSSLVRERSASAHHATLLHYIAANGVQDALQITPPNAVQVAECLLRAGSEPDAVCDSYGGNATTMGMLVSSVHPSKAGVQGALVRTLCAYGAAVDGIAGDGEPMGGALLFGYPEAVAVLAELGARTDNIVYAAASGRLDILRAQIERFTPQQSPRLKFPISTDETVAREQALVFASLCDQVDAVGLLLDAGVDIDAIPPGSHVTGAALHTAAYQGNVKTIRYLLDRGADLEIVDPRYKVTPLVWAQHGGREEAAKLLAGAQSHAGQ